MQSPSSPLATAGQRPDQSISVSNNASTGTSLADGVNNHDSSENSPKDKGKADAITAAAEVYRDSADDNGTVLMQKRLLSEPRSSHESKDLQEQSSGHTVIMNGQAPKMTDLIDRELKVWSHSSTTLITKKWPEPWMAEIVPGLFLGDVPASICPEMLQENRIHAMVSLYQCWSGWKLAMLKANKPTDHHIFIRCEDSLTLDVLVYMSDICDFIDQMAAPALRLSSSPHFSAPSPSDSILVHCEAGRSRSPTIIIAYLMRKYCMNYKDALSFVRTKRKVKPNPNFIRQLQIWGEVRYNVWKDDKRSIPKAPYQAYLDERAGKMGAKQDLDAIMNAKTALNSPYPIGPKFEPPYCCKMVNDCPCKDSALRPPRN